MAMFEQAVKGKKFRCDECKGVFAGEDVKLKLAPKNFSATNFMTNFLFVDKDGAIKGGNNGPDGNIGDQTAHCPLCGRVHLFGFDVA